MDLKIPKYALSHNKPVVGYGCFGYKAPSFTQNQMFDITVVDQKFALWDKVMQENLLESKDEFTHAKAISLLMDKTIMAYAQLKYDNIPIKLLPLQDCVLSDTHDRILFCGCNQIIGKSFTLNVDSATEFLMDHGKNWIGILVSGSLPQSQFQMDRIKMILKSSHINYREEDTVDTKTGKKDNTTQLSYTFYSKDGQIPLYKNLLICCPHTSSALGYPADMLWLDEFDFWENCDQNHFLYQIAIPRTYRTKGKVKIYSNPDGKEKMMYKLWNEKKSDGTPAWHRYHFNYWDKPGATQTEFDNLIIGESRQQIESTLLAVFTRTEGSFFSSDEIKDMHSVELDQKADSAGYGRETAWFLDVGAVHDQCSLNGGYAKENQLVPEIPLLDVFWIHKYPVGYPLARVVGVDTAIDINDGWEDYATDNPPIKKILSDYAIEFNNKKLQPLFGFDATGNAGMLPLFSAVGIDAMDITFTGKLKWHMYQRYQYYVQQRFIKRAKERDANTVRGCDFDYQASKLVVKNSQRSTYKQIHHENEEDLDDTQDAVAGFIHLIENPDLPSLSFDIINPQDKSKQEPVTIEDGKKNICGYQEIEAYEKFKDQYIPSFMDRNELEGWIEQKEKKYR